MSDEYWIRIIITMFAVTAVNMAVVGGFMPPGKEKEKRKKLLAVKVAIEYKSFV